MDREKVIQLSMVVEQRRAEVRNAEANLRQRRASLAEAEHELDKHLGVVKSSDGSVPTVTLFEGALSAMAENERLSTTNMSRLFDWKLLEDRSVSSLIREFFAANPNHAFGAGELMEQLSISKDRDATVRQTLKRLFDEGYLMRDREGVYRKAPGKLKSR